jgi:acetyl esterase/lipase
VGHLDLSYVGRDGADDRQHTLDIYAPVEAEGAPLVMWIHGGAWITGDRANERFVARRFAEQGIVFAPINHRLAPGQWLDSTLTGGVMHPAQIEDCAKAFAWLHAHARDYGADPRKLFVAGYSSGGHLAALLATDGQWLEAAGLSLDDVRGAIPMAGAYDLVAYHEAHRQENGPAMADAHVKGVFGAHAADLRAASPTTHLAGSGVPMLVLSEGETHEYTRALEQAAEALGGEAVEFDYWRDETHASLFNALGRDRPCKARTRVIAWIRRVAARVDGEPEP